MIDEYDTSDSESEILFDSVEYEYVVSDCNEDDLISEIALLEDPVESLDLLLFGSDYDEGVDMISFEVDIIPSQTHVLPISNVYFGSSIGTSMTPISYENKKQQTTKRQRSYSIDSDSYFSDEELHTEDSQILVKIEDILDSDIFSTASTITQTTTSSSFCISTESLERWKKIPIGTFRRSRRRSIPQIRYHPNMYKKFIKYDDAMLCQYSNDAPDFLL